MTRKWLQETGSALSRRRFVAGTAAAAGLSAVGFPAIVRAQTQKLKLGVLLPRSGFEAKIGQANQVGFDVAQTILRNTGSYPEVEFIAGDTESDVTKARTAAEKMINEGVHVLTGCFDSGQTAAVAQVAEQKGIPFIINIAAAPAITEQGYKFVVRNFPNGPTIVRDAFVLQKELFKVTGTAPKTVVVLHINDTFGSAIKGGINALYPKMDMPYTIVDQIAYDPKARDVSVEVGKAKATGADVLWTVSRLNDAILITREMVKQRWEPMAIMSSGPGYYEDQYLKTLGKLGDYAISYVPWYDPKKRMTSVLLEEMARAHPETAVDTNHVYSFEAALIAADAYKRANSTAPQALMEAIRTTDITDNVSIGPGIKFDEKGQNKWLGDGGIQNQGGKPVVIVPVASAAAEAVFPMPGWRDRG